MNSNPLAIPRHLEASSGAPRTVFERFSSGIRMSHGADDPARRVIADTLRRDIRVAARAMRNTNDALSAFTMAEKALGNADLLTRLSEVASEAATGTPTGEQRSATIAAQVLLDRTADSQVAFSPHESRLLSALANLRVAGENFATAAGRIRDADVAAETALLARARILEEPGTSVLAFANLHPAVVFELPR